MIYTWYCVPFFAVRLVALDQAPAPAQFVGADNGS